jgi:hypothetical protein
MAITSLPLEPGVKTFKEVWKETMEEMDRLARQPFKVEREDKCVMFSGKGARDMEGSVSAWNAENEIISVCASTWSSLAYHYGTENEAMLCYLRFKQ